MLISLSHMRRPAVPAYRKASIVVTRGIEDKDVSIGMIARVDSPESGRDAVRPVTTILTVAPIPPQRALPFVQSFVVLQRVIGCGESQAVEVLILEAVGHADGVIHARCRS